MINALIAVIVYEFLVALIFILCWLLVRELDARLPISDADGSSRPHSGPLHSGLAVPGQPGLPWQVFTVLLGALVLTGVALLASGFLGDLRRNLIASDWIAEDRLILALILPAGHLVILLGLFLRFRSSVQFPTIAVHLLLLLFCLLVTLVDPSRLQVGRLTLVPIFATNLVLLILTHGLLTLLFCRTARELVAAVVLAAVAGLVLALGALVISLVAALTGGPLFFFQLYLISAFGIFGLYFCALSILLGLWARD